MVNPIQLQQSFHEIFGCEPRLFSAPGRINLIGEHTDYNEGFVLPMAADRRTFVAAAATRDTRIDVCSFDLHDKASFEIAHTPVVSNHWVSYVHGVARSLIQQGAKLAGAQLAISSDVPIGAGLSSSAALEVSVGYALLKTAKQEVDLKRLALACQEAEHRFVGTKSGLMDQLTATFAEAGRALFIDCRSLEITPVEMNLQDVAVVVCNTGVTHQLAASAYNDRRRECEQAVEILQRKNPSIRALRDVTLADLQQFPELLPEQVLRRCMHVVTENERTIHAKRALESGNVTLLGKLMNLSHESLRDDYEVSCRELDLMVDLARQQSGTYGARMMGGGFGGSTVNMVRRSSVESFAAHVSDGYKEQTGIEPDIMIVEADRGVEEHTLNDNLAAQES
ncbi:MAG TPA: galactokinase [Pyrinomonadaceae bacterium]